MKFLDIQPVWQTRWSPWLATACIVIFVITAALSVRGKSTTWDEPYHLTGGLAQLQVGDPRLNADHPPLARMLAALPGIFSDAPLVSELDRAAWKSADLNNAPSGLFGMIEDRLLWPSRLMMLTLAGLLGWMLYAWAARLYGPDRAWIPVALFAFSPVMLANAPLVATDMAAATFMFAAFYTWWCYLQEPSIRRLTWVCLAVVAALASKHTALLLAPAFVFLGAVAVIAPAVLPFPIAQRMKIVGGGLLVISFATVFGIDLVYFFDGVFLTPPEYVARSRDLLPGLKAFAELVPGFWPSWLPIPLPFTYVIGLVAIFGRVGQSGHWTDFLGQFGLGGWQNYFLVLLLVKLSVPTLILIVVGNFRALSRLPRNWWNVLFLSLPPLFLIGVASSSKVQIGIRHILPAIPFLFLLAAYSLRQRLRGREMIFICSVVALNVVSSFAIYPHYLMYFNFIAGGPEQGWRIAAVGNDWGQGDADLQRWLQTRQITSLAFLPNGWGGAVLNRANIRFTPPPCQDTGELVAVHVQSLVIPITEEKARCYTWMRIREPDEKIGYSIFIYNSKNIRPAAPANLTLFSQALNLQLSGQRMASIPIYRTYLTQEPNYYQAHFNLGAALLDTNQCSLAIPEFERTLELWPGYKEAHVYLEKCYREIGRLDKARAHEAQMK